MSDSFDGEGEKAHRRATGGWTITRRDLLKASGLVLAQLAAGPVLAAEKPGRKTILRFGMFTDSHYADVDHRGSRYYRQSATKLAECVKLMNAKKADFLIELGDFKDEANPPAKQGTVGYLRTIEAAFGKFRGPRYHVLGNHDTDSISKATYLANVENTKIARDATYYSFDLKGLHFVVLDADFRADGTAYDSGNFNWTDANVSKAELDWLRRDLKSTSSPVIVFAHQLLDGKRPHSIKNAAAVRKILQGHKKVLASFHGHKHDGGYSLIEGIHYYTLKAMVEGTGERNSSYALVEVLDNHDIVVTGYRKAVSKDLAPAAAGKAES